jgi:hypothetical protein
LFLSITIRMDKAAILALKARAKDDTVKTWLQKWHDEEYSKRQVQKGMQKIVDEMATKSGVKDAEAHLKKYRDALMILPIISGVGAPSSGSLNRAVAEVRNSFTRRVTAHRNATSVKASDRKEATSRRRLAEKAGRMFAAAEAIMRGEKPAAAAAAPKSVNANARLANLITRKGRSKEKQASIDEILGLIALDKPPKYLTDVIDALQSQRLRFNRAEKQKLIKQIKKQIAALQVDIDSDSPNAGATAKQREKYAQKKALLQARQEAMEILKGAVEIETNVENSAASSKSGRTSRTHRTMRCVMDKLSHPCNPKVKINFAQLQEAVAEMEATGKATRPAGAESTASTALPSGFTTRGPSNSNDE